MSVYDVRGNGVGEIDKIVFADVDTWGDKLTQIERDGAQIRLANDEGAESVSYSNTEALNLIKALQKAVELGWIKEPVVKKAVAAKKPAVKK